MEKVPKVLKIVDEVKEDADFDIQAVFFNFTLDSICDIAFGRKHINSLEESHPFGYAFDQANYICTKRFFIPPVVWKLQRALSIGNEGQLKKHVKVLQTTVNGIVAARLQEHADSTGEKKTLLPLKRSCMMW